MAPSLSAIGGFGRCPGRKALLLGAIRTHPTMLCLLCRLQSTETPFAADVAHSATSLVQDADLDGSD